jgi:hypothetical protein
MKDNPTFWRLEMVLERVLAHAVVHNHFSHLGKFCPEDAFARSSDHRFVVNAGRKKVLIIVANHPGNKPKRHEAQTDAKTTRSSGRNLTSIVTSVSLSTQAWMPDVGLEWQLEPTSVWKFNGQTAVTRLNYCFLKVFLGKSKPPTEFSVGGLQS